MTEREYNKIVADARRSVSRKYGFRQSSYINFMVEDGYFFCLIFLTGEARLTVKPMYADDLWWDIWGASGNKKEAMSLRGTGAYSLSGQVLATYEIKDTIDKSKLESQIEQLFNSATVEITKFIADNPDADLFYPDESRMDHDPDRLLYLMALIHNDKKDDALAIINEARKNKHRCMFRTGMFSDSYTYISRWCKRKSLFSRFHSWIFKHFTFTDVSENVRRVSAGSETENCRRKPWYRLFPDWIYYTSSAVVIWGMILYFRDLHKRMLYDIPSWVWLAGILMCIACFMVRSLIKNRGRRGIFVKFVAPVGLGIFWGLLLIETCICLFDVANLLFASNPVNAPAIVTCDKHYYVQSGRSPIAYYLTTVALTSENKMMEIDNRELYDVPPKSEVIITYRHGLFGIDIFDGFSYPTQ